MSPAEKVFVTLEFTPNPNTLKYLVNRQLLPRGAMQFKSAADAAAKSALAELLYGIDGIASVMFGRDFVTVTKTEEGDWDSVHQAASESIESYLSSKKPLFKDGVEIESPKGTADNAVVARIQEILDNEIRPAVAMDGGDIAFERYEDGIVYLHLQGACAGCPGAAMTLKMGVENRLREAIPEIVEVVSV